MGMLTREQKLFSAPERMSIPQGSNKPVYNEESILLDALKPDVNKACRDECLRKCPSGQKCTWSMNKGNLGHLAFMHCMGGFTYYFELT